MNKTIKMMKNSNEIRPPHTPETEGGDVVREAGKLYNQKIQNEHDLSH